MTLSKKLLAELRHRFAAKGPLVGEAPGPLVRFPPRHPEFGEVSIAADDSEAIIDIGVFTHLHVADYTEGLTDEERADRVVAEVCRWLEALFEDRVIAWGGPSGGGCEIAARDDPHKAHTSRFKGWVWSGPWQRSVN